MKLDAKIICVGLNYQRHAEEAGMPIPQYPILFNKFGNALGKTCRLGIRLYLNGELRQNSNTADMIFKVDEIISYISSYMTLEPGDLIITGTPEGVIAGYPLEQRVWLKPGDTITVEIEKLGRLTNTMIGE